PKPMFSSPRFRPPDTMTGSLTIRAAPQPACPQPAPRPAGHLVAPVAATAVLPAPRRVFLMLQGPHGPFFDRVGRLLRDTGAQVWRVSFNAGDEFFWSDRRRLIRHAGSPEDWPEHLDRI